MPIDSHLPQADLFSLVPTFKDTGSLCTLVKCKINFGEQLTSLLDCKKCTRGTVIAEMNRKVCLPRKGNKATVVGRVGTAYSTGPI